MKQGLYILFEGFSFESYISDHAKNKVKYGLKDIAPIMKTSVLLNVIMILYFAV